MVSIYIGSDYDSSDYDSDDDLNELFAYKSHITTMDRFKHDYDDEMKMLIQQGIKREQYTFLNKVFKCISVIYGTDELFKVIYKALTFACLSQKMIDFLFRYKICPIKAMEAAMAVDDNINNVRYIYEHLATKEDKIASLNHAVLKHRPDCVSYMIYYVDMTNKIVINLVSMSAQSMCDDTDVLKIILENTTSISPDTAHEILTMCIQYEKDNYVNHLLDENIGISSNITNPKKGLLQFAMASNRMKNIITSYPLYRQFMSNLIFLIM